MSQSSVTVHDNAHNITYVGFKFSGTEQFQGINYGQDTSGSNRFRAPRAFNYSTGTTVQATTAGAACPQATIESFLGVISENPGIYNISEDCLNLQVVRPAGTRQNANLPVMVFFPSQSFSGGSYNISLFNPTALVAGAAAKRTPVIYVAMNYRVNAFGFANSPALRSEGSLNAGILDQRLALQWIQSNIATFGGNPRNVTAFGESDGAVSAGLHLTSNGGNGKPQRDHDGASLDYVQVLLSSAEQYWNLVDPLGIQVSPVMLRSQAHPQLLSLRAALGQTTLRWWTAFEVCPQTRS